MSREEAKELLLYHSFTHENINHPKAESGFLGMLRPFKGELIEANFHEVMEALKTLADELENEDKVDKEIILALWGICHLGRAWAIHPDGMLRRNNLIKEEQIQELEGWIEDISYATMFLLDGSGKEVAFEPYNEKNKGNS
jgi:hypothetical protein